MNEQIQQTSAFPANKLAPFNPTGDGAIDLVLELSQPTASDVIYDLGCGDGRVLVRAALSCQCKCVGVEYDATLVGRARKLVEDEKVSQWVSIEHNDALLVDLTPASIIFLYLVPKGILQIKQELNKALERGAKIVTYMFSIPEWEPKSIKYYKGTKVYLYCKTYETQSVEWTMK